MRVATKVEIVVAARARGRRGEKEDDRTDEGPHGDGNLTSVECARQASETALEFHDILYAVDEGGIARVTINRPERRNALGASTVGELIAALSKARDDAAVRVVVLTGAGKIFCAGGDLSQMSGQAASAGPAGSFVDLNLAFTDVGKPTIAMVNGHALAGGLGLVTACDLAIASSSAQFGTPEIDVGLWPMMIMATIFRNVPRKQGLEMILTGERLSAERALHMGLVNRVAPAEKLEEETMALARKLAAKSPTAMRLGLRAFHATQDLPLAPALEQLQRELFAVLATEDAREGLTAFFEKRAPRWTGR